MNRNQWSLNANDIVERFVKWIMRNPESEIAASLVKEIPDLLADPENWCNLLWPDSVTPHQGLRVGGDHPILVAFLGFLHDEIVGSVDVQKLDKFLRDYCQEEVDEIEAAAEPEAMGLAHSAMEA